MLILALVFALILDSGKVWLARFYRVGIFVPYAVPTVIAALMWGFLYGRDFGPFADIANALGLSPPNFLSEKTMLFSIANVSTWTYTGYNMIILYAALRSIPSELYEAAAVDGAGAVRTAIHIKLPLLRPALLLCTIFSIIGSMQLFAEPQIFFSIAPRRDRQGLHAEPLRVQPRVRRPAAQLRGRAVVPARARSCSCSRSSSCTSRTGRSHDERVPSVTPDAGARRHRGSQEQVAQEGRRSARHGQAGSCSRRCSCWRSSSTS